MKYDIYNAILAALIAGVLASPATMPRPSGGDFLRPETALALADRLMERR